MLEWKEIPAGSLEETTLQLFWGLMHSAYECHLERVARGVQDHTVVMARLIGFKRFFCRELRINEALIARIYARLTRVEEISHEFTHIDNLDFAVSRRILPLSLLPLEEVQGDNQLFKGVAEIPLSAENAAIRSYLDFISAIAEQQCLGSSVVFKRVKQCLFSTGDSRHPGLFMALNGSLNWFDPTVHERLVKMFLKPSEQADFKRRRIRAAKKRRKGLKSSREISTLPSRYFEPSYWDYMAKVLLVLGFPCAVSAQNNSSYLDSESELESLFPFLGIFLITLGFVFLFFGERLAKPCLFIGTWLYSIVLVRYALTTYVDYYEPMGFAIGGILGLVVSALTLKFWKLSLFAAGAACGVAIWLFLRAIVVIVLSETVVYSTLAGLILGCALLAVQLEKQWLRFSSPLIGTALALEGISGYTTLDFEIRAFIQNEFSCTWILCYDIYILMVIFPIAGYVYQEITRRRRSLKCKKKDIPVENPIEGVVAPDLNG